MRVVLDDSMLDDQRRLFEADTQGLLRQAALAGAQVRSAAHSAAEVGLDVLGGQRPRALVLLSRPGVGAAACDSLAALLGSSCPVPVVRTEVVPSWIGPLDVVFAHGPDGGDRELAESLEVAGRRGAGVVLATPDEGPVAAAVAGRARTVSPRIPVAAGLDFAHVFTVGACLLEALGLLRIDTEELADALDERAAATHPAHESSRNPAKNLALRLAERMPLLWGVDELATAVAGHGAFVLGCYGGVPCDVGEYAQAVNRYALYDRAASAGSEAELFADPGEGTAGLRVLLLTTRAGERAGFLEQRATAALPGADVLSPPETAREDATLRAGLLAVGFDMAAVYLGLASGLLDGHQRPMLTTS
ncbi:hypothetical protein [Actinopolyspora mortivallis]|uniref:hypothetical protein n=1 Tax=Actinopolyspora mortivallis TaxID=33906 RepID=UPI0003759E3F